MKQNWIKGIIGSIIVIFTCFISIFFEDLVSWNQANTSVKRQKITQVPKTNQYGLEESQELCHTVLYEDEDIVCFPDRVYRHFSYEPDSFANVTNIIREIHHTCSDINKIYIMPIPTRILYEDGYVIDKSKYATYMDTLLKHLDEEGTKRVELLDVSKILMEHRDEYLFFRTEDSWTLAGAYYGASYLCELLGHVIYPLESYERYEYNDFKGSLCQEQMRLFKENEEIYLQMESMPDDPIIYYLRSDNKNRAQVYSNKQGKFQKIKRPMISHSEYGLSYVIGNNYQYAVLDSNNQAAKNQGILLLCDHSGKMIAPYLTDYYKTVYVVNVMEENDLKLKLNEIVRQYEIADIVWIQKADNIGDRAYSSGVLAFLQEK